MNETGQAIGPAPSIFLLLIFLLIIMLRTLDQFVEHHGDCAQNNNRSDHHIELEHLRAIDNQIPESASGGKKFPDDDAHKGKTDIDLHTAQNERHGTWQDHLGEGVFAAAAQRVDQLAHFRVNLTETGIETDNGTENSYGDTSHDNGICAGAKPYDQKRRKGGFWQGIQDDEVGFQNFGEAVVIP